MSAAGRPATAEAPLALFEAGEEEQENTVVHEAGMRAARAAMYQTEQRTHFRDPHAYVFRDDGWTLAPATVDHPWQSEMPVAAGKPTPVEQTEYTRAFQANKARRGGGGAPEPVSFATASSEWLANLHELRAAAARYRARNLRVGETHAAAVSAQEALFARAARRVQQRQQRRRQGEEDHLFDGGFAETALPDSYTPAKYYTPAPAPYGTDDDDYTTAAATTTTTTSFIDPSRPSSSWRRVATPEMPLPPPSFTAQPPPSKLAAHAVAFDVSDDDDGDYNNNNDNSGGFSFEAPRPAGLDHRRSSLTTSERLHDVSAVAAATLARAQHRAQRHDL
jgi:hypothetical protein